MEAEVKLHKLSLLIGVLLLVIIPATAALQGETTPEPDSTQEAAPNTNPTATVDANVLNVRDQPSTSGAIIAKVNFDESYPVLRGLTDGSWWQIQLADAVGWVSGNWVTVANTDSVPLDAVPGAAAATSAPVDASGATATVLANVLNVRDQASLSGQVITQVRRNEVYNVLQQSPDTQWWLIDVNGTQGWVSARFVNVVNFTFGTSADATAEATAEATAQPTSQPTAQPTTAPTATATP
jgi:uncharacterized protein YgiM (DUF1202 family)